MPIKIIVIFGLLFLIPFTAFGSASKSLPGVINDLMASQGVNSLSDLNCDLISDRQFETLGETLLVIMHPSQDEQELISRLLGGSNSDSLQQMKLFMGQRYLGCRPGVSGWNGGYWGMMGQGSGMMSGWFGFGWFNSLVSLLIVVFLVLGITYFWKEINRKK